MKVSVRTHQRTLPSGKKILVKRHKRNLQSNAPFMKRKGVYHLPIRTAIIVPSTSDTNKPISSKAMARRVKETRQFLAETNGGYTSVRAVGGFTDEKNRLVKEPVVVVESYATKKGFKQNRMKVRKWLENKGSKWKQEAMGYEHENDLYYVDSRKTTR